ncbi:MAG: coiled-coil domain-containing protein [Deltaproteobacteria bacterium]
MANTRTTNNIIAMAIIAILLLLGTTGYFWNKSRNLQKDVVKFDTEINQMSEAQEQLEKDYEEAINSLDELKGDNQELNSIIDKQKEELKVQKNKISSMLKTSKDLNAAKAEIEKLKAQAEKFIQEINDLKSQNLVLTEANQQLQSDKTVLSDQLSSTTSEKMAVTREKDSLSTAKQRLEKEKQRLFVKANKASAIMLDKIDVKGYMIKKNGKQTTENDADDVQMLKICFNMLKNEIADQGQELFYLRLIAPDGNTLYDEKAGSGVLTKSSDETKMNYTKKYLVDYNGQTENICLVWNKEIPLIKGRYKVELYNKGYFSGVGEFKLK